MFRIALKMLAADRAKFAGLLFGIAFTSFLVTFAASYFCGFMTRGFSLITENPTADVWVMDPAVESAEQTINLPTSAWYRVRSVDGVESASPLALGMVDARFPNGRFQTFQVIGVEDATLAGAPMMGAPGELRARDAVIVDGGGTVGKLQTPSLARDRWPHDGMHLDVPTRELAAGDELLANDQLVRVLGRAEGLARFPPRPLLYTTFSNAARILPGEPHRLTFVMAKARPGVDPRDLAARIGQHTGLRARTREQFKSDTVRWFLINSEDVGDIAAMLTLAMTMGFGVTGVMLFMFTYERQTQYAVLKTLGATPSDLVRMVLAQAAVCALIGTGLGLGLCGVAGEVVLRLGFPFRMMWFTPVLGIVGVLLVCAAAAVVSLRPVIKLRPAVVFAGR
ncbi:putative ABC transport system permease protein [Lysobacter niabensis]|uniref:ABC transport system permease protein n=1 Tax=Agrilutibacter niabensis TaxID=380628 RepID=A0ABU1VT28_9GAMM|nr:ABC transporter permease [Lysobacter niabensis]MDR7100647.1 putative ABC transport system permease protein [Lysobacter niabensis]